MNEIEERKPLERRTVLKGAAWTLPVIAAGVATPAYAASEPSCPQCLQPAVGAYGLAGVAANYHASLLLAAPLFIDATQCGSLVGNWFDLKPAFTYIVTSAKLTMSDGSVYDSTIGLAPGAGSLGTIGGMPGVFNFNQVRVGASGGARYTPTSITVTINTTYKWGIGATLLCPTTLTWKLGGASLPVLIFGAGPVAYAGFATR